VYGPTAEEYEQILLDDWFQMKEAVPYLPYNAHKDHTHQYGRCLWVVVNVLRLVADGKAVPLVVE
jgi:hypothetical protein